MNIQLAGREHEQGLRELLSNTPMPGWIHVTFDTNPDFFQAISVHGHSNQTLVAVEDGRVLGMGCRSIKPMLVNGSKMSIGYLSGLRLLPEIRRSGLLARGYRALKNLHDSNPVPAYLTTIIESNRRARKLLTSGRATLPHYLDYGHYFSYAINLRKGRRKFSSGIDIRKGEEVGLSAILSFLAEHGRSSQFFPVIEEKDIGSEFLRGLRLADFRAAVGGRGEIIGVSAVWNQCIFKQNNVRSYASPIRILRPAINTVLFMSGYRPLPVPGEALNSLYVSFNCVRNNDPEIFRALLERIYSEHQAGVYHFLFLGLHERDPLRATLSHFPIFRYKSHCYLVCWNDGLDFVKSLDPERIPYIELATM
ncbi:MAG: hypothetical protein P8Z37_18000 [Acidobacteriota bacterium]